MSKWKAKPEDGSSGRPGRKGGGPGGPLKEAMETAREHMKAKNYTDAKNVFETILKENPESFQPYFGMGNVLLAQGELDKALEYYEGALHLKDDFIPALMMCGQLHVRQGDLDRALEKFKNVVDLNPSQEKVYVSIAKVYEQQGNNIEAFNVIESALKQNPQSEDSRLTLANLCRKNGDVERAFKEVQIAIDHNPFSWKGYAQLCEHFIDRKDYTEAIQACNKALELKSDDKDNISLHVLLARAYAGAGKYELALNEFALIHEKNPRMMSTQTAVARIYLDQGKYSEAKKILVGLTKTGTKGLWVVHVLLADVMIREKKYDLALSHFKAAVLKGTKLLEKHPELSDIEELEGSDKEIANAYKKVFDSIVDQ